MLSAASKSRTARSNSCFSQYTIAALVRLATLTEVAQSLARRAAREPDDRHEQARKKDHSHRLR